MLTAPETSNARDVRGPWRSRGTSRRPAIRVTSATGAGRKKTQRQPISVSSPPITSPSEKPVAPVAVKIESALLRAGPSANDVVMIESAAGAVNAALTPLTNRVAIRNVPSFASPPSIDATTNTPSAIRNTRRRPSRSAARPPSSRKPP